MNPMMGPGTFFLDFIFNFLFVSFGLVIFFKTKELYELTKYKGIKYFRYSFLFLSMGYLFRIIGSFPYFFSENNLMKHHFNIQILGFPINFFGILAIFYLFLSIDWKKGIKESNEYLIYIFSLIVSIIAFITRSYNILILLQLFLLIFVIIIYVIKNKSNIKKMFVVYSLLLFFWILNLLLILPLREFSLYIIVFIKIISLMIMSYIFFKVFKWIK